MNENAIRETVKDYGGTVLHLNNGGWLGKAWLIGYESRDILIFDVSEERRTEGQQKFADKWRGVPPVDVCTIPEVDDLMCRIHRGEFEAHARYKYFQPDRLNKLQIQDPKSGEISEEFIRTKTEENNDDPD